MNFPRIINGHFIFLQIFVKADLPVGKNLQDHGASPYYFTVNPEFGIDKKLSEFSTIAEYIDNRSGTEKEMLEVRNKTYLNSHSLAKLLQSALTIRQCLIDFKKNCCPEFSKFCIFI